VSKLPQGRPDSETDGMFMIRAHKVANEYGDFDISFLLVSRAFLSSQSGEI